MAPSMTMILSDRPGSPAVLELPVPIPGPAIHISLVGQDRPGIARQLSAILTGLGTVVETFDTRLSMAPHSGAALFHIEACLRLPLGLRPGEIQAALEEISAEILVDVSFGPLAHRTAAPRRIT